MKKILVKVALVLFAVLIALVLQRFRFVRQEAEKLANLARIAKIESISTLVVPHYDFAKERRQKLIKDIGTKTQPKKIVVISVNHFGLGEGDILTTDKEWNFAASNPKIDKSLYQKIINTNIAKSADNVFEGEHGIKNVLPDLASQFKTAEFLPIIIKNGTSQASLDGLLQNLETNCPDCLLVSSIDFSHYNQDSLSQIHDQMSLSALYDKDSQKALLAETDSPEVFYLTTKWVSRYGDQNFVLSDWSNSSKDTSSLDKETTSFILGYYSNSKSEKKAEDTTTFLFAGDMMFDRLINHQFRDAGLEHVFDNFGDRVFWGTDIAFANLEGPISDEPISDDISTDNLIFNFPPESIKALKSIKLNSVSLANNHSLNAGQSGLDRTKKLLDDAKILHAGEQSKFSDESVLRYESEIPVSVIAVNILESPGNEKIIEKIKSEKSAGRFVIVFPHWGNEYSLTHSKSQETAAHTFIDAGADFVVGSHSHVVQDVEIYNKKPIVYSLGNFVFDQTFSSDTQVGLLVGGKITTDSLELSFFPTKQVKLKPEILSGGDKSNLLERILSKSGYETVRSDTIKLTR